MTTLSSRNRVIMPQYVIIVSLLRSSIKSYHICIVSGISLISGGGGGKHCRPLVYHAVVQQVK